MLRLSRNVYPVFLFAFSLACGGAGGAGVKEDGMYTESRRRLAPDFPAYAQWINTAKNWSMADFRGKVVLLDFWTYCCINCMHVLPDLKKLEQKYPELVVVGVHSAKFSGERDLANIREAVLRYDIEHPVVNDYRFELWNHYGIKAWPSFALIDPDGGIVEVSSGEGVFDRLDGPIGQLIAEFDSRGRVNRQRIVFELDKFAGPRSLLSFPGKLEADTAGRRLFISDSNNERILVTGPEGRILDVIGSGMRGSADGAFERAEFFHPQGMVYDAAADVLYIADTENHLVRRADLKARTVETVLGTGRQARGSSSEGRGISQAINSPWDLEYYEGVLVIAMAGPHQLWSFDPLTGVARVLAGSGRENIVDGPAESAQLAQPSGLSTGGGALYFADSEVSAVRRLEGGIVSTLVGKGLFEFGDIDGLQDAARFQHPLGVLWHDGLIYVADTYNDKIRRIDPQAGTVTTVAGTGETGRDNGPALEATLNEPNDIKFLAGRFYITDTNNGLIRVLDPQSGRLDELELTGLDRLAGRSGQPEAPPLALELREVAPGMAELAFEVKLPEGHKPSPGAPQSLEVFSGDRRVALPDTASWTIFRDRLTATVPLQVSDGETNLTLRLDIYYCETGSGASCYLDQQLFELPLHISGAGSRRIEMSYMVRTP